MSRISSVCCVSLHQATLVRTRAALFEYGKQGLERLVLWVGTIEGETATVLDTWVPPQNPIASEEGVGYLVTGETLHTLNHHLSEHRVRLIAQVHSHPAEAYHSAADDAGAIVTANGGFSIVVPDFARAPMNLESCGVYRLRGGQWRELSAEEVRQTFVVRP